MKRYFALVVLSSFCSLVAKQPIIKLCPPSVTDQPIQITQPGKYLLCNDFTYTGTDEAIKITSSNVELCLFARNIVVTDDGATGISIIGLSDTICEIKINNDSIEHAGSSIGSAISIVNACKVHIENMFTKNFADGISIENSFDISIDQCDFSGSLDVGSLILNSSSVTLSGCTLESNHNNMRIINSHDINLLQCSFFNPIDQQIQGFSGSDLLVKNCSFSKFNGEKENGVTLGFASAFNNARFACCTFFGDEQTNSALEFIIGSNLIIDRCLFDVSSEADGNSSSILNFGETSSNIEVSGCTLNGTNLVRDGIISEASNVAVRNSSLSGFTNGITLGESGNGPGSSSTVHGCSITNCISKGIDLNGSGHVVSDNFISPNGSQGVQIVGINHCVKENSLFNYSTAGINFNDGTTDSVAYDNDILCAEADGASGIALADESENNVVQENRIHSNTGNNASGIRDTHVNDTTNLIVANMAHNNTDDYDGISPNEEVSVDASTGTNAKAGRNLKP